MSKVLIVAEHAGGKLNASTAKSVKAASTLPGAEVTVAVFTTAGSPVAAQAAKLTGVAKVLEITNAANEHALAATLAPQVAAAAAGFSHVFAPSTTFGKDLMPRVAALLDAPQVSDIMAIESATRFKRPIYAGNAITTVEVSAVPVIVGTIRTASFEAAADGGSAAVESTASTATLPTHTRFLGLTSAGGDRPDLQSATKVISGGRALASADAFKIIYSLADKIGAAVGASRAAVDAGYVPSDMQVGQTGKIIAPELYVAVGISGAIQHLTGIKDARTIVAINRDAEAPIFEVADVGLVGDWTRVLPELLAALRAAS